jgi:hypothetical protein
MRRNDFFAIFVLLIVFIPHYFGNLYTIPWQINTDEIAIMIASKTVVASGASPFGVSYYFNFPNFPFLIFGKLSLLLGGITLNHFRMVHAAFGMVIIVMGYLFLRQSFTPFFAFSGAAILGSNHALLSISRMAMRDNSALLSELMAFTLLLFGLRRESRLFSFLGGALSGLTFYVYYPARITIFIWGLVLVILYCLRKFPKNLIILGLYNLFGFLIVALPIMITSAQTPDPLHYHRSQFLFFDEGQALQMEWTGTKTPKEAIQKNIVNGLTAFNNKIHDQGYIYPNPQHGFLDPLTGLLIWIGMGLLLIRPQKNEVDILVVIGFLSLWLTLSLLITKAPHYTRLLTTLPFVSFLAITAIQTGGEIAAIKWKPWVARIFVLTIITGIVHWNLSIYNDFVQQGIVQGNDVGGTARYVEDRRHIDGYHFYLAANNQYPYYSWGEAWQWKDWMGFFAAQNQKSDLLSPDDFLEHLGDPPFTVFLRNSLWEKERLALTRRYQRLKTYRIKTDGSLLAIEAGKES